jgi:hypothetical protein
MGRSAQKNLCPPCALCQLCARSLEGGGSVPKLCPLFVLLLRATETNLPLVLAPWPIQPGKAP